MWDSIPIQDLAKRVHGHLTESGGDKSSVAKDLVTWAKDSGSSDNITVIVVFLRDQIAEPKTQPIFDFGATPSSQGEGKEEGRGDQDSGAGNSKPGADNSKGGGDNSKSGGDNSKSGADNSKSGGDNSKENDCDENDNKNTSNNNSSSGPTGVDIIVDSSVDIDSNLAQEYSDSENGQYIKENGSPPNGYNTPQVENGNSHSDMFSSQSEAVLDNPSSQSDVILDNPLSQSVAIIDIPSSQSEAILENPLSQSETRNSDRLPSRHRLTKNEPIFIFESHSNQNSPRAKSELEQGKTKVKDAYKDRSASQPIRDVKQDRSSSLPNHIHFSGESGSVSEFHHRLKMEGFQESGKKKLPALQETHIVSEYAIDSDNDRDVRKDVLRKKSRRIKKTFKDWENKEQTEYSQKSKRRIEHSGPIVWAFTGKNVAPVQNYKLNQAAKSTHPLVSPRVALASLDQTPRSTHPLISPRVAFANLANTGALDPIVPSNSEKYLEKLNRSKHIDVKNSENIPVPHNIFDYPLSTFTSSYSNPLKAASSTVGSMSDLTSSVSGKSKDRGSKYGFHPLRPRRSSKFGTSGAGFAEVPPTPLTNTKLQRPADSSWER